MKRDLFGDVIQGRYALVEGAMAALKRRAPSQVAAWGPRGAELSARDFGYHLDYLASALACGEASIFSSYLKWVVRRFDSLGLPRTWIDLSIDCLEDAFSGLEPGGGRLAAAALATLGEARGELARWAEASGPPEGPRPSRTLGAEAQGFLDALLSGEGRRAGNYLEGLAASGLSLPAIYLEVAEPALREIGELWMDSSISVAKEHYCTAAAQFALARLYPRVFACPRRGLRVVAACVGEELHEVGLRMVADLLELDGWDSVFLGANTPDPGLVAEVEAKPCHLICLSATLDSHLPLVARTIEALRESPSGKGLPVLVGGSAFNAHPGLWSELGADAYAPDARGAVSLATALVAKAS